MSSKKIVILDLFCGAGGAAMGLHRAMPEARIVGVDINPQKHYPFEFIQADAMTFDLSGYDFIWASPPCQGYSTFNNLNKKKHPMLIPSVRALLEATGQLYVIENVPGSPLISPVRLCGSMFGLRVRRHRLFEANFAIEELKCFHESQKRGIAVYGDHPENSYIHRRNGMKSHHFRRASSIGEAQAAMGIDWMDWREITQAIPPAYSEYIGLFAKKLIVTSMRGIS